MSELLLERLEQRPRDSAGGHIAWLTVNNPERRNALGMAGKRAIANAFHRLAKDDQLRAVVITGAGDKSFIAGADINEMRDLDAAGAEHEHRLTHLANQAIRDCPVPVIARVNGYCLGFGMELAAACDIRIGGENARFGMPEVRVGIPSGMEAALLPQLIGWGKAAELVLTGDLIDAAEAHRIGFLQRLVAADQLDAEVERCLSSLLAGGARVMRLQKGLLRDWEQLPISEAIEAGIAACVRARDTDEPRRMMQAFIDRKKTTTSKP